jgi:hypothetical protein
MGEWSVPPRVFNLGTTWIECSFSLQPFYLIKGLLYPLDEKVGGTQRLSGGGREDKNLSVCRHWNTGRPACRGSVFVLLR